ncbi:MAG TPA: inosine/xanthosine triphosphatase [Chloroflexia bacterium]|nr:inosine/xanthosine triphosphatase [Chloroflexia bacterium]
MHNPQSNAREPGHLVVAVGSKNPVKVGATRVILTQAVEGGLLPGIATVSVEGLEVPSGVSDQPVGEEETRRGALSRARNVLKQVPEATWGVGIEGGILRMEDGVYTCAWAVIADRQGVSSSGGGLVMPLPTAIVRDLDNGLELGDATDRLFGVKHSKHAGGALGYLSKNLKSRQDAYEGILTYALVKFLHPELYELT